MAREHPEKEAEVPQVVEREINLSMINSKLNELMNLNVKIAQKLEINLEE